MADDLEMWQMDKRAAADRVYVEHHGEFRNRTLPLDRHRASFGPGPGARITNPPVPDREQWDESYRFPKEVADSEVDRYYSEIILKGL